MGDKAQVLNTGNFLNTDQMPGSPHSSHNLCRLCTSKMGKVSLIVVALLAVASASQKLEGNDLCPSYTDILAKFQVLEVHHPSPCWKISLMKTTFRSDSLNQTMLKILFPFTGQIPSATTGKQTTSGHCSTATGNKWPTAEDDLETRSNNWESTGFNQWASGVNTQTADGRWNSKWENLLKLSNLFLALSIEGIEIFLKTVTCDIFRRNFLSCDLERLQQQSWWRCPNCLE